MSQGQNNQQQNNQQQDSQQQGTQVVPNVYYRIDNVSSLISLEIDSAKERLMILLEKEKVINRRYKKYGAGKKLLQSIKEAKESLYKLSGALEMMRFSPLGLHKDDSVAPPVQISLSFRGSTVVADISTSDKLTKKDLKYVRKKLTALAAKDAKRTKKEKIEERASVANNSKKDNNKDLDLIRMLNLLEIK